MFTYKLADEFGESGVTVNSLHLGVINTKLLRGGFGSTFALGLKAGVKIPVFLASSTKVINVTGKFFVTRLRSLRIREYQSSPIAYDKESQNKLWEVSLRLVKI
jgi:hypothetical protein